MESQGRPNPEASSGGRRGIAVSFPAAEWLARMSRAHGAWSGSRGLTSSIPFWCPVQLKLHRFQPLLPRSPIRTKAPQLGVERLPVMRVLQVTNLVDDHVLDACRRSSNEFRIQVNHPVARSTPPTFRHGTQPHLWLGQLLSTTPRIPDRDPPFELKACLPPIPLVHCLSDAALPWRGAHDMEATAVECHLGACAANNLQAVLSPQIPMSGPGNVAQRRTRGIPHLCANNQFLRAK